MNKKAITITHTTIVEELACLLLGVKLPLDIYNEKTGIVIIPAHRKINKTLLGLVADAYMVDELGIDPSPIRNRVLETLFRVEEKYKTQ